MSRTWSSWPSLIVGGLWLLLLWISVSRLWSGLKLGRIRWRAGEYERAANPSAYWTTAGVYSIVPALTLALLAWMLISLFATD
jgi:hypothetical protein